MEDNNNVGSYILYIRELQKNFIKLKFDEINLIFENREIFIDWLEQNFFQSFFLFLNTRSLYFFYLNTFRLYLNESINKNETEKCKQDFIHEKILSIKIREWIQMIDERNYNFNNDNYKIFLENKYLKNSNIVVKSEEVFGSVIKGNIKCKKINCKSDDIFVNTQYIRSSDEPPVLFYLCGKCGFRWQHG